MKFIKKNNIMTLIKFSLIALNLIILFYMFSFYHFYLYESIVTDEKYIAERSKQVSDDIHIDKFNKTLEQLANRTKNIQKPEIINFFW